MTLENIGMDKVGEQVFSLFKSHSPDGRLRFLAKTSFSDGEVVLIDHWNLAVLQKKIREYYPIMEMARNKR